MSKKIIGIALTIASVALIATGVGAPLGLGTIGIALGGTAFISDAVLLGIGLGIVGSLLMGPAKPKGLNTSPTDRLYATLVPTTPRKIAFGHTALDTDVRYQAYTGANQEYLDQIVCHASHEVHSIDEIWLDNELAWSATGGVQGRYAGYLTVAPVTLGTSSNGIAIDGTWTSSCTLTGCAYSHLRYKLTGNSSSQQSPFASGVTSRMTVRGKGAKVYDPRLDSTVTGGAGTQRASDQTTWAWDDNASRNPALQELFYELGWKINGKLAVGKGVPPSRIDLASFAVGANHCDESVTLNGGGTEPRYRSDGVISEADDPSAVRDNLCWTMNAMLRDAGGKLSLTVIVNDLGTPVAPSGKSSFDETDIQSELQWEQTPDLSSTYNIVRGQRIDPSDTSLYQPVDYPPASLTSNDGIDRIDTFNLQLVQSNGQAQRLAKQRLQRNQYQGKLTFTGQPSFWGLSIGDVFPLSLQTFGWSSKLFRVASQKISRTGATEITAVEENAAIYQWDNNEAAAVTPGAPVVYNPLNSPILIAIGAPGDSNRVRFSRLEQGTAGWAVLYNPASLPVTLGTGVDTGTGKPYVGFSVTFTAASQQISLGTNGNPAGLADFRMPVNPGERLFVGGKLGISLPAGSTWRLAIGFLASDGATVVSEPTVISGSGNLTFPAAEGDFIVVPTNAATAWIETYLTSGGAGAAVISLSEPLVCGAGSAQTVAPAFSPGPSAAYGADVTALISAPPTVTVFADSTGTPKSGQLPLPIDVKYLRSGVAMTSGVSWSASNSAGNATSTISGSGSGALSITGPTDSTFAQETDVVVTGVYNGVSRSATIRVLRQDDPPTSTGTSSGGGTGTTGSTTTVGNTTGTTYDYTNAVSPILTGTAGASGQVACSAPLGYRRTGVTLSAGPDGENGAAGKWQWRTVGGTWADIGAEVLSSTDSITNPPDDTGRYVTTSGTLSVSQTKTGLTPGTAYQFQFCWRRIDVTSTAENLHVNSGTLQAAGS